MKTKFDGGLTGITELKGVAMALLDPESGIEWVVIAPSPEALHRIAMVVGADIDAHKCRTVKVTQHK